MGGYLPLLRQLMSLNPPAFVFGSIAEMVLLDGQLDRSHGDLDLVVPRDQLEPKLDELGEFGFADFVVYYEPRPGRPLILGSSSGDLAMELNLLDHDATGRPYFAVRTDAGPVAVSLPGDMLDWPPTTVEGVEIRTVSPLALIQIRAGITATEVFGAPRPGKDASRQARLIEAFFPNVDERSLAPEIFAIAEN